MGISDLKRNMVCQARQHTTAQCFWIGRHHSDRDTSDTPGLISSKRLHPRERHNNICCEGAQLHVHSCCETTRRWTVRKLSFILN